MTPPLPAELAKVLRQWGERWHLDIAAGREAMLECWQSLLAQGNRLSATVRNVADGEHPRQVLDVHCPAEAGDGTVMVFVQGGAFVRGDKDLTPTVYSNVPQDFARHGFVAVNVEYRLAPEAAWPAGARDVIAAVQWIHQYIANSGGNPSRIFLMAHSAGCSHAASALWDEELRPAGGLPVAGLVLASPRVDADVRPENPNAAGVRAYYGDHPQFHRSRSPMNKVRPDAPPTFVAVAQYENPLLDFQGFRLAHLIAQAADLQGGPMVRFAQYLDHNHVSLMTQFNTVYNQFGMDIRDWCRRVLEGAYRTAAFRRHAAATPDGA